MDLEIAFLATLSLTFPYNISLAIRFIIQKKKPSKAQIA